MTAIVVIKAIREQHKAAMKNDDTVFTFSNRTLKRMLSERAI